MTINLIAINGLAHSGKDTIAAYLTQKYLNTYTEHFADPLKEACARAFGIPLTDFQDPAIKELPNDFWQVSPREIAQFVGTEMFRDMAWKLIPGDMANFWVKRMAGLIQGHLTPDGAGTYEDGDTIVIPDLRFQNEYDFIIANDGIVIHLTREGADGTVGIPGHASEAGISFTSPDRTYRIDNNGTMEELYAEVEKILDHSGIDLFYNQTTPRNQIRI